MEHLRTINWIFLQNSHPEPSQSYLSLSNSYRHSANADVIADVKRKIIVTRWHFFADVVCSASSKIQNWRKIYKYKKYKIYTQQTKTCLLHISRSLIDILKHICFTFYP